jgi:conjugative relaxase-like TrwC/TraI family protein
MLTISKPLSAGQAQSYHQKEFTAKEQNYWSHRGEIPGEWQGRLAAQLGLAGAVSAKDFAKLSQGQHPETGEQLVRQRASYEYQDADGKTIKTMEHRAGWDATFSAPKSVSLTALVGGDDRVREAHRQSVSAALEQLEYYTQARIGGNHPPETTGKFIAAKFEHDTARPVDGYVAPQLHTHAVIFNLTDREDGQARAIQPQSLFASQQFATAVYQSELMYRLKDLGYEITIGRSGAPEIKGYTQEYLDASSPRSQQIREYLERTGRNGREAAEIAAHSTRDRKEIHSPGEVMAAHRKLAADFGHQADAVVRTARDRQQLQEKPSNAVDLVRESLTFSRDKNFEREAVVDERALIRDGLCRGMGDITFVQVRSNLNARIASGEFQAIQQAHMPGRRFTTAKTIAAEHEIIGRVREGRNQIDPLLPRSQAIAFADQHQHLNRTQRSVVEDVLSSPDRIQGIQGFAGSGTSAPEHIRIEAHTLHQHVHPLFSGELRTCFQKLLNFNLGDLNRLQRVDLPRTGLGILRNFISHICNTPDAADQELRETSDKVVGDRHLLQPEIGEFRFVEAAFVIEFNRELIDDLMAAIFLNCGLDQLRLTPVNVVFRENTLDRLQS